MTAVYGARLAGHAVIEVPAELAEVFADAHRRVAHEPAGVHLGDGVVTVARAATPRLETVPERVVHAIDLATRPVVLAGPGVVLEHAVGSLHELAERAGLGVLNTWGAKGVFEWRSPHHLATVGLQTRDFERGGLAEADLIVATGLDEREVLAEWRLAPVLEVAPGALAELATRVARQDREIVVPPLRTELAAVTQAGWERTRAPLPPSKLTQHYSRVLGEEGLVAADPGIAGFWVARTFATQQLGGAQVTADREGRGFAVACCTVARLADPDRPVLAVVDAVDEAATLALDVAHHLGVEVPVEVWADDGDALDAGAHHTRLYDLVAGGGQATIATDPTQLEEMLAVAGPIVAWTR